MNKIRVLQAGIVLGFIALTKVLFAYVIVVLFFIVLLIYLFNRASIVYKKLLGISLIAFLTLSPYVMYTYHLTGKAFYLSTVSGEMLYWMSSPYEHEYGDWNNHTFTGNCSSAIPFCNSEQLKRNHGKDYVRLYDMKSSIAVDSLLKELAIQNIKTNPGKYVKNWYANVGRLLFGFPSSYYFQSPTTLVRIYINSAILLAMIFSLFFSLRNWKKIPVEIKILVAFSMIYLSLSSLVSAYPRQFNIMIPAILIWITYALKNSIKIDLKMHTEV
jgi:4-amino-4-deoxy-L-arabinose transferase-like glycosyltransferase